MNASAEWRMERPDLARREPRRGRGLATRLGVAALGALVFAGGAVGLRTLYGILDVPIAVIGVDGRIANLSAREVEDIVAANLSGGFLSLDLDRIRKGLEAHPWVESATARRQWPNQLVIVIREETPIARWGDSGFLNNRGQTLDVANAAALAELPLLAGPEGMEREVMQQYRIFTQLLQATGLAIVEFRMGERGGWHLRFADGPTLAVGRGQITDKIQRFLKVWDKALAVRLDQIDHIDIRYGNGVAVRWKTNGNPTENSEKANVKRATHG
ncbi:MAG: cell division protein FtsQ/DivIB [Porticoccaceae bacterium]|jgi:cell division protein FtsQ|nr:cell division protein FtsQ/DivIB [Porticoccaceae bacterium]MEA3298670.1 cell division protein FtsQ/DivIB [Pseudomonadota bacterium]HLS99297.1 cell division protein FtsQ/DivIB [Porticoccaceae bacterium]